MWIMKKDGKGNNYKGDSFWMKGFYARSMSSEECNLKVKTINMKHDEEMNYSCKKCSRKISAHNRDWHDGLCDDCFNGMHFKGGK